MLYTDSTLVEAENSGEEMPEQILDPETGAPLARVFYTRTDGWRGHWDTEPVEGSGWVRVEQGWVTGAWDDAPAGHSGPEVETRLNAMGEDQDTLVVMTPTSNVFAMGFDVYQREGEGSDAAEPAPTL
jgi:hypothetical protein